MASRPPWLPVPEFERAVIEAIMHDQLGAEATLEMQGLRLLERKFTGVGLYSDFYYVDADGNRREDHAAGEIPKKQRIVDSNIFATAAGSGDIGLGLILYLEEDLIQSIEAYSLGADSHWWGHVNEFSLHRVPWGTGKWTGDWRSLRAEEEAVIAALCEAASVLTPDAEMLGRTRVRDIGDPSGAIRFFDVEDVTRRVDRLLADAEYRDDDGATMRIALWLDNEGNLFGLDMWKPDFAAIQRYPKPGDLTIRTAFGARVLGNPNLDMFEMSSRRAIAAGRDRPDSRDRDALAWLQSWYLRQCDGNWEHGFGVDIDTLDNPGWQLKIQIEGTPLEGRLVNRPLLQRLSDRDWIKVRSDGKKFEGFGGPSNLAELIEAFRRFVGEDDPQRR